MEVVKGQDVDVKIENRQSSKVHRCCPDWRTGDPDLQKLAIRSYQRRQNMVMPTLAKKLSFLGAEGSLT
jgi:hypothetical protein